MLAVEAAPKLYCEGALNTLSTDLLWGARWTFLLLRRSEECSPRRLLLAKAYVLFTGGGASARH